MFSFDFSGHGRSPGILGFDNAETDRLAKQILTAKERFKQLSGLNDSKIILLGHSMGARAALQATTIDTNNISGLILLGTQVNLETNVQSNFFTGVNDVDLEWIQNLNSTNPDVNILLMSGTWDDILTKSSALLLYNKIANVTTDELNAKTTSITGKDKELAIFPALFHNYEIYSPRVISKAKNWAAEHLGLSTTINYNASKALFRIVLWFIILISIFTSFITGSKWLDKKQLISENNVTPTESPSEIKLLNVKKFFLMKLLLWLGALVIGVVVVSILMLIPLGLPVFNLVYVGFFGGFGILLMILYRIGKVPGTEGKWIPKIKGSFVKEDWKGIMLASGFFIFLAIFTAFFARTGFFYVIALNARVIWLILFTPITALGLYIGQIENHFIQQTYPEKSKKYILLNTIIGLVPFFIQVIFFLALGSISGFLGGLHGLVILAIVFTSSIVFNKINKKSFINALFLAFIIQWLVLPQGALFSIFY